MVHLELSPKGLLKRLEEFEIRGRTETIPTTVLLRSVRILRRVPEIWGDFLSLRFQLKTTSVSLKEKRLANSWILLENWKGCGTRMGWWCQLLLVHLEWLQKAWKKKLKNWKLEEESRPSSQQHCWEKSEYWEESWKHEETCCYLNSCERPPANGDMKSSQGIIIIIIPDVHGWYRIVWKKWRNSDN